MTVDSDRSGSASGPVGMGRVGVWTTALDRQPADRARLAVQLLEELGYGTVWVGEARRREAFVNASLLLSASSRITVATGIANIWARDAQAMRAGQLALAEAYPGRFLLGIGVSHAPLVAFRGHDYHRPLTAMGAYLDAMASAVYESPLPSLQPRLLLAALGPRMLRLAGERSHGAHPYFVPVAHTRQARTVLGPDRLLCPEQAVVIDEDPERARGIARQHTKAYLRLDNYRSNLLRLGFSPQELVDGGSDRLVDELVAWGDVGRVAGRIQEQLQGGADHVAVQVLTSEPGEVPDREWRSLAAELTTRGLLP
ncbi:MAG TPA: LLM class F420-dependent oxidoreductase [Candidatus Dormibacteraeota bacterium]|nr:LLM class F420-dependent oxidoreductase [Candidatus Dormibacteraeota bacterium]